MVATRRSSGWDRYASVAGILFVVALAAEAVVPEPPQPLGSATGPGLFPETTELKSDTTSFYLLVVPWSQNVYVYRSCFLCR